MKALGIYRNYIGISSEVFTCRCIYIYIYKRISVGICLPVPRNRCEYLQEHPYEQGEESLGLSGNILQYLQQYLLEYSGI